MSLDRDNVKFIPYQHDTGIMCCEQRTAYFKMTKRTAVSALMFELQATKM